MALTLNQKPGRQETPIGQKILFSVVDSATVASYYNVRYYCDVYFSYGTSSTAYKISTLKTTPNSMGYGIFDINRPIEAMIKSPSQIDDTNANISSRGSSGVEGTPVHYITHSANVKQSTGIFYCKFRVEASVLPSDGSEIIGTEIQSSTYTAHNIFPDSNDIMYNDGGDYYFNYEDMGIIPIGSSSKILSDMPLDIDAGLNDVGTIGFFQNYGNMMTFGNTNISEVEVMFFESDGSYISATTVGSNSGNGGSSASTNLAYRHLCFSGIYPGNIKQHTAIPSNAGYYLVTPLDGSYSPATASYRVNITQDCKHKNIRLAWLNKYGAWDYYSFNKKSIKSTASQKKTFNQTQGSYQGSGYVYSSGHGGAKVYDVQSKESYVLNTDYVSEEKGEWLESIINSTEVYIIKESEWESGDSAAALTNFADLVEPVMVTTNSISTKTVQNDKLVMHTFKIEKSMNNNTRTR